MYLNPRRQYAGPMVEMSIEAPGGSNGVADEREGCLRNRSYLGVDQGGSSKICDEMRSLGNAAGA